MFAIVRTGGKQYRVAPGDKIVVEKLAGETGDSIDLTDILLAGEGSDMLATAGLIVGAEIVAQAKSEKVTVFKKRRRHNYRRKAGHRQQLTILKILSIGDHKEDQSSAPARTQASASPPAPTSVDADQSAATSANQAGPAAEASTSDAAPAKATTKKAAPKAAASTEKK
jgi:large subunit ribosomal protein L21